HGAALRPPEHRRAVPRAAARPSTHRRLRTAELADQRWAHRRARGCGRLPRSRAYPRPRPEAGVVGAAEASAAWAPVPTPTVAPTTAAVISAGLAHRASTWRRRSPPTDATAGA